MVEHINQSRVYAEVYAVLSALSGEYIRKTPHNVLNVIAEKRDRSYEFKIDENKPLEEQNLSKEAIALLTVLKLDYWCENQAEKKELQDLLILNEEEFSGKSLSLNSKKKKIDNLKSKIK